MPVCHAMLMVCYYLTQDVVLCVLVTCDTGKYMF